ncbi:cysteine dioxygenase family protein [Rhodanobacter sp. PCA2]|uniref:cysteine dioxygenase n=1 Tax=Rhodanobacter sp. PCA2 TaxID=2006117 RepID=UPI0015E6A381|nr:cysteine dioxygenase family protein [Rhodanobacter sp. PCA2]MBA2078935.1 cysteine dioxygenase [Rhodanobacter sp. PCA2]
MCDAHPNSTAVWTHRVLAATARGVGDGRDVAVAQLTRSLAHAAWWEGCPAGADVFPAGTPPRYRRISLREPLYADDYSVLLIAWPPGHATPIHDHDGLWGLELVLDGILGVESYAIEVTPSVRLAPRGVTPLGIGDHATFSDADYAHRCRNLSAQRPALSLHVYGGALRRYRAFDQDAQGRWDSVPHRTELELANR